MAAITLTPRALYEEVAELLRQRIFAPLGMKNAYFKIPADQKSRVPAQYANAPGGKIVVSLENSEAGPALVVSDTGPGIPPEDRARVTDRFVRLERSRHSPGTGLGLSLVAAVARLHEAQLLSYLRLSSCEVGLLINFHVRHLRDGIRRVINSRKG